MLHKLQFSWHDVAICWGRKPHYKLDMKTESKDNFAQKTIFQFPSSKQLQNTNMILHDIVCCHATLPTEIYQKPSLLVRLIN